MRAMVTPRVVLALVVGGCSDGGGEDAAEEATTTTGPFEPTLRIVPDQPADAAQLDAPPTMSPTVDLGVFMVRPTRRPGGDGDR